MTRSVGAFFTDYDLLVTPTLGQLPAPHGTLRYDDPAHSRELARALFDYGPFTVVFNISGQPAISLPLARSENGLPIGVQFVAPYGREDLLFSSPPSSKTPCPGSTGPRTPTLADADLTHPSGPSPRTTPRRV